MKRKYLFYLFLLIPLLCCFTLGPSKPQIDYFPSASISDHGAAGVNSVKSLVDAIGSTKKAKLIFSHSGTGNTTSYTFATSEEITSNITIVVEPGAYFTYSGTPTLTIDGPIQAGLYAWINPNIDWVDFGAGGSYATEGGDRVYPQWWGAIGDCSTDCTKAIQRAVDTERLIYFPQGTYVISDTISSDSNNTTGGLKIQGENAYTTQIRADTGFTGYMIEVDGHYCIRDVSFRGLRSDGVYGLGCDNSGAYSSRPILDNVYFTQFDIAIYFTSDHTHQLGLYYNNLHIQYFKTAGIVLGGTEYNENSGGSNYVFDRIEIQANDLAEYNTEFTVGLDGNSPDSTHDALTWTGTTPTFGFVVMRSLNDASNWHTPPNWNTTVGYTDTNFSAEKTAGETWYYRVVPQTVGLMLRNAKAVSCSSMQTEYVGVGQYYSRCKGLNIDSTYYEMRDVDPPRPAVACIVVHLCDGVLIDGGFIDGTSWGVIPYGNATVEVNNVTFRDIYWAAIGRFTSASLTNNVRYAGLTLQADPNGLESGQSLLYTKSVLENAQDYNNIGTEFDANSVEYYISHTYKPKMALRRRDVEVSSWYYDASLGMMLTGPTNGDFYIDINGNDTGDGLFVRVDPNNAGEACAITLAVTNNERVGVGTSSPTQKLDVQGNVVFGTAGTVGNSGIIYFQNGAATTPYIDAKKTVSGIGSPFYFSGQVNESIGFGVNGNGSGDGFFVQVDPNNAGAACTTALSVTNNNRVGVGTTTPDDKFEIEFPDPNVDVEIGVGTSDTDITFITLRNENGVKCYLYPDPNGTALVVSPSKP